MIYAMFAVIVEQHATHASTMQANPKGKQIVPVTKATSKLVDAAMSVPA
jgi:hypothetical protein